MQIRQMKSMFSAESEIDQLSVFVGTWNMGRFLVVYSKKSNENEHRDLTCLKST